MRRPDAVRKRLRRRIDRSELLSLGRDSSYVAVWQGTSAVADLAQIALLTHVLGISEYGRFAIAVALVVLVSQLLDFRVGVVATTVGAQELARGPKGAAGAFQVSYFLDVVTGIAGFFLVLLVGAVLGPELVGEDGFLIIAIYAVGVLGSTTDEASLAVLRLLDGYRLVAIYGVALEALRIGLVALALAISPGLVAIALAICFQRVLYGIANGVAAATTFSQHAGVSLFSGRAYRLVRHRWREMARTALSTNVVSYMRLAQAQLPTLLLGYVVNPFQVGLYKLGTSGALLIAKLGDPPRVAFLPRIARMWADDSHIEVRNLVYRLTISAIPVVGLLTGLLIVFRDPLLRLLGGEEAEAASAVLVIAAIAFAINIILFWNDGILFAAGKAAAVAKLSFSVALVQIGLLLLLVEDLEAVGAAIASAGSLLVANLVGTVWAYRQLRTQGAGPRKRVIEGEPRTDD